MSKSYFIFQWLETVVMSWLIRIYSGGFSKTVTLSDDIRNAINTFKRKLSHFLYETYTKIRIDHLFSIIIGAYDVPCASRYSQEFIAFTALSLIWFSRISRVASRNRGSANLLGED